VDNRDPIDPTSDDIAERIWEQASARLRAELADATWHTWFQGVRPVRFQHDVLVLAVPSTLALDRIRTSYHPMLGDALREATGRELAVDLLVDTDARVEESPADATAPPTEAAAPEPATIAPPVTASESPWAAGTLNSRYTFDQFVIGASNRFAHAAALSVAEASTAPRASARPTCSTRSVITCAASTPRSACVTSRPSRS